MSGIKAECVSSNNDLEPKNGVILTACNIKVDIYRRKKTVLTEGTNNNTIHHSRQKHSVKYNQAAKELTAADERPKCNQMTPRAC